MKVEKLPKKFPLFENMKIVFSEECRNVVEAENLGYP